MIHFKNTAIAIATAALLTGCAGIKHHAGHHKHKKVKNVIMVIGDGMGPQQVGLLLAYANQAPNSVITNRTTAFDRLLNEGGSLGLSMTYANNVLVTDSAASATQLSTGQAAGSEMIGANKDGDTAKTILEVAQDMGKSTGVISDTRATHATPAAFAAHQTHRSLENEIAVNMLETGPDIILSGGLRYWIPEEASDKESQIHAELTELTQDSVRIKSKRNDSRNLLTEAQDKGYSLAFNKEQLANADGKILGLFAYSAMNDGIKNTKAKSSDDETMPSLPELTQKALDVLSQNENGFALMVEAGQIDWAGHYNDTGLMLHEMLKINDTLHTILDFVASRDDTLLVVTADHETGGFGFSYSGNDIPEPVDLPGDVFSEAKFAPRFNFGDPSVLDKLYAQKLSYGDILYGKFDALSDAERTPENLARLVNEFTEFDITAEQAKRILATEKNPMYVEGHKYLGGETAPDMVTNTEFFVYQSDDNRQNLLAREVATKQQVVWATGTHTATPVLVFSTGNKHAQKKFSGIMHHTLLSQAATSTLCE